MNLLTIPDQDLLDRTEKLATRERELLAEVLRHLREIARRRLFASLGYKSLFDYCVRHLRYSEDQAGRRIAAMRLLEELPEIEDKIADGVLTLSHLGLAQAHFRIEEKLKSSVSRTEKLEVLAEIHGKSQRDAQKIIVEKSSSPVELKPDRVRRVSREQVEIKFLADAELLEKLERIKGLLAHRQPRLTMAELLNSMSELALDALDPARKHARRKASMRAKTSSAKADAPQAPAAADSAPIAMAMGSAATATATTTADAATTTTADLAMAKITSASQRAEIAPATSRDAKSQKVPQLDANTARVAKANRAIPTAHRRRIWREHDSKCANCGSRHALQIEHLRPFACDGSHEPENLTLLCRSCNQRSAIEYFGLKKMHRYLHPRKLSAAGPKGSNAHGSRGTPVV